jgi:hypothetical protein
MKTTNYNNGTWGRYNLVHKLGRVGYAELINMSLIVKKMRRVIFYIK